VGNTARQRVQKHASVISTNSSTAYELSGLSWITPWTSV